MTWETALEILLMSILTIWMRIRMHHHSQVCSALADVARELQRGEDARELIVALSEGKLGDPQQRDQDPA